MKAKRKRYCVANLVGAFNDNQPVAYMCKGKPAVEGCYVSITPDIYAVYADKQLVAFKKLNRVVSWHVAKTDGLFSEITDAAILAAILGKNAQHTHIHTARTSFNKAFRKAINQRRHSNES